MSTKVNKYKIGFWNYVDTGVLNPDDAVKDWKDLGMNTPMSFNFNPDRHDKKEMLRLLDACEKNGMKLIVCDSRTALQRVKTDGEKAFAENVKRACDDFASHPAFYGFNLGDEPNTSMFPYAEKAYKICADNAPDATHYVNLLPFVDSPDCYRVLAPSLDGYGEVLDSFMEKTKSKSICFDFYAQCAYFNRDRGIEEFFQNLRLFEGVARRHNAEAYFCPLSVGHWMYVLPDEDLFRWQLSVAISHGITGLFYFYVYQRFNENSYRVSPIDLFWERTETFGRLSRVNRIFAKYYAEALSSLEFVEARHFGDHTYGGYKQFVYDEGIKNIGFLANPVPLAVSVFKDKKGNKSYVIVNLSQNEPTCISLSLGDKWNLGCTGHMAPGEMFLLMHEDTKRDLGV